MQHPSHGLSLILAFRLWALAPDIPINKAAITIDDFNRFTSIEFNFMFFSNMIVYKTADAVSVGLVAIKTVLVQWDC